MARSPRRKTILSIIVLLSVTLLVSPGYTQGQGGVPPPGVQDRGASALAFQGRLGRAAEVKGRHADRLMAIPGVVGAGVGLARDGRPGLVVLTKVPGVGGVPTELEGVPVETVVTGEIFAIPAHRGETSPAVGSGGKARIDRTRAFPHPVPIGVSTGNANECSAGTIGARVKNGKRVYALSNNHVYSRENAAVLGESILQPGLYDTRCAYEESNVIGTLADDEPIAFDTSASNTIDAAIALTDTGTLDNKTPADGYGTPSAATADAALGLAVRKYGRTSGQTSGTVYLVDTSILVVYSSGTARFDNQIGVLGSMGVFIKAGDSGSLLVTTEGNHPVGLLFAGDNGGKHAFANPIDAVLATFGVAIDGAAP